MKDAYQKSLQAFASNPKTLRWMVKTAPALDRFVFRATRGRFTMSGRMMPIAVLTTTGARTGVERETPLLCVSDDEGFLVVGSNFGQTHHPAWSGNLLKNPHATVAQGGKRIPVTGALLTGEDRARAWKFLTSVWPPFDKYVELAGGREIRVFRLTPKASPAV
ncbi:hypothetical protein Lesp02_79960 [Lentzea sp. NBRC 105346]|nr:hypothetical protein Lesp02_79960 [Lentzea sp. NBRC 105346]